MPPIASASDLYRYYEKGDVQVPILKGLEVAVEEGEFLCVMGPSGSGKTTLLHVLSGLDPPDGGTVTLGGRDVGSLGDTGRTRLRRETVGYVFQFFNLLPNLTVLENVQLPLAIAGERAQEHRERLVRLLHELGLEGREGSYPHQLSGGEMQRVSIARAVAGGQPLLLCDEPTGNLSQRAGLRVMQILRRLRDEEGRSVLLVTHNPRDACFADRVVFLVDGEIAPDVQLAGPDLAVEDVHAALSRLSI